METFSKQTRLRILQLRLQTRTLLRFRLKFKTGLTLQKIMKSVVVMLALVCVFAVIHTVSSEESEATNLARARVRRTAQKIAITGKQNKFNCRYYCLRSTLTRKYIANCDKWKCCICRRFLKCKTISKMF
ncbi:uncharacterized protein LOC143465795 [Clavelina lepadiformis]|uniref:uncharacterized protein LOC143465795 n=1 Tax=Clavelina lepadiformis TaxID=159417 RepID=UPI004040FE2F